MTREKKPATRSEHICLADKYGWDTVECYTAEPLASDSGDEKRIKKAIKESEQLREEKRKSVAAKWKAEKSVQQDERSRHIFQETPRSHFSTGKSSRNLSRDSQQVCFRCFRSGRLVRECRAAVTSKFSLSLIMLYTTVQKHQNGPPQSSGSQQ